MSVRPAQDPPAAGEEASPDLPIGEELELPEGAEAAETGEEEIQGVRSPQADEDLSELEAEIHDERENPLEAMDPDELIHVAERPAGLDDDEPGPATASDGEDGADELGSLEAEAGAEDDEPGERGVDDADLAGLDEPEPRDEDAGAEGIAGEDPSTAIEEAPAIDGAEGEGEGLGEALPDLDEGAPTAGDRAHHQAMRPSRTS